MNLNELRYAVALAAERHFGRAAARCHVSQPTLSLAVKHLEEELGVPLFERGHKEATLTPAGERVLAQARRVLEEVERLRQEARSSRDELLGPLRLGAIYTVGPYVLPELIPQLARRAPRMPLVVEEDYTASLARRLKAGDVDAILIALPFEESGVVVRPLYDEPFVALLPGGHPLVEKDTLNARLLAKEPMLLLNEGHCFRRQVLEFCPQCLGSATDTAPMPRASSLETLRHMVVSGLGITLLPLTAASAGAYGRGLLTTRRLQPEPKRTVALAWRVSFPRPKAIDALVTALRAARLSGVRYHEQR